MRMDILVWLVMVLFVLVIIYFSSRQIPDQSLQVPVSERFDSSHDRALTDQAIKELLVKGRSSRLFSH